MPTIFHSAWSDSWAHKLLPNETPVMFHNQTKINKSMQCEVCKIECNSKSVFEKHISGKKHQRNLQLQNNCTDTVLSGTSYASSQIQTSGVQGNELFVAVGRELESKKQKLLSGGGASVDSVKVCSICNIACNSQEVLSKHLAGKKHAAKVNCAFIRFSLGYLPLWDFVFQIFSPLAFISLFIYLVFMFYYCDPHLSFLSA